MQTFDELAGRLELGTEEMRERLLRIGLAAVREAAEQLADADAVDQRGFAAVLQEPMPEPQHWLRALDRLDPGPLS